MKKRAVGGLATIRSSADSSSAFADSSSAFADSAFADSSSAFADSSSAFADSASSSVQLSDVERLLSQLLHVGVVLLAAPKKGQG